MEAWGGLHKAAQQGILRLTAFDLAAADAHRESDPRPSLLPLNRRLAKGGPSPSQPNCAGIPSVAKARPFNDSADGRMLLAREEAPSRRSKPTLSAASFRAQCGTRISARATHRIRVTRLGYSSPRRPAGKCGRNRCSGRRLPSGEDPLPVDTIASDLPLGQRPARSSFRVTDCRRPRRAAAGCARWCRASSSLSG